MLVFCFFISYRAEQLLRFFGGQAAATSLRLLNFVHVVVERLRGDTTCHYDGGRNFSQNVRPTLLSHKSKNPADPL